MVIANIEFAVVKYSTPVRKSKVQSFGMMGMLVRSGLGLLVVGAIWGWRSFVEAAVDLIGVAVENTFACDPGLGYKVGLVCSRESKEELVEGKSLV